MEQKVLWEVDSQKLTAFSEELNPTKPEERNLRFGHFFSLWMGAVHNIPSYLTVGGFFAMGLSVFEVLAIILISAIILAGLLILNGHAGYKYGIPYSILLRSSFGEKGSLFPGILRGVIASILWFGLQTYAGSVAISILIGKIWPSYITIGGDLSFLGLNMHSWCSFILFWMIHVFFIFGGIQALGYLTKFIAPLIFIVFGGMSIWFTQLAGGVDSILRYEAKGVEGNRLFIMLTCISAILATWVAPILSVSDFTRYSRTFKGMFLGQLLGILTTYILFAIASISIIIGSELAFGAPIWNILEVIERFDFLAAIILSLLTVCLSTLSVNITGNLIPAGNQLSALFPKYLTFIKAGLLTSILGCLIMPWKLMENATSIFAFLNIIGGLLSPVIGVMVANYFLINKSKLDVAEIYHGSVKKNAVSIPAIVSILLAGMISLAGNYVPSLSPLYSISWFTGIFTAMLLYISIMKISFKNH